MGETYSIPRSRPSMGMWPPDDTEESVVGTDLHQTTIMNLRWGINEAAASISSGEIAPWQALSQTVVTGFQRGNNTRYKTMPDVFVYRQQIDRRRGSVSIALDGPPALIIEVLSESTYDVDLDLDDGKGYSYARAGVGEYLTLDPTGEFLPEQARAWRLEGGVYQPWAPDVDGRWRSEQIAVAIGVEGVLAAVYGSDGRRQLREGEISAELARRDGELARRDDELARRDDELARRDDELARRDDELARRDGELARLRQLVEQLRQQQQ